MVYFLHPCRYKQVRDNHSNINKNLRFSHKSYTSFLTDSGIT